MSVGQMREILKNARKYNYNLQARATWVAKVNRMHDRQVIAVYYRMLRGGEL